MTLSLVCKRFIIGLLLLLVRLFARQGGPQQFQGMDPGTLFGNVRVWSAMIQTDPSMAALLGRDFHKVPQGVKGTAEQNAWQRVELGRNMTRELPFRVDFWWSVFGGSCPHRLTKGNDRGVSMAHHQIWADWVYQGRFGAHASYAADTDLMVVFEDDAVVAVNNVTKALETELLGMKTDLLFLGWCYGRRHMPMVRMALCMYDYEQVYALLWIQSVK